MRRLAFDLGASSGKMLLGSIRRDRLVAERIHVFPNRVIQSQDNLFWDLEYITAQMQMGIRKAVADGGTNSFGIDSFNNDFGLLDEHNRLILPIRCYRDARMVRCSERIYQRMGAQELYNRTGNQLGPFNTLMQLASMPIDGDGESLKRAERLVFLPDLLMMSLGGSSATEYSIAAETQLFDQQQGQWIPEIAERFDIPLHILPRVLQAGSHKGPADNSVGELIAVCEHDTASAFAAAPVDTATAILSIGTWSIVGIETAAPIVTEYGFQNNIANEGGLPDHHRVLKNVMGTWILQQLLEEYRAEGQTFSYENVQFLAGAETPFRFVIDPDDPLFYAPGAMRSRIRQYCLQHSGHAPERPGEFFRCVYEGLSLRYCLAIHQLSHLSGKEIRHLHVIGGGSLDAFACQTLADASGLPVSTGPADASALGNLLVQFISAREISDLEDGRTLIARSFPMHYYEPLKNENWVEQKQQFCYFVKTTDR